MYRRRGGIAPQRMEVLIRSGNVTLDFTDAEITSPALQIDAEIHHGNMNLVTRPGIVVAAYGGSGALLLAIAAIGLAGVGPLAS